MTIENTGGLLDNPHDQAAAAADILVEEGIVAPEAEAGQEQPKKALETDNREALEPVDQDLLLEQVEEQFGKEEEPGLTPEEQPTPPDESNQADAYSPDIMAKGRQLAAQDNELTEAVQQLHHLRDTHQISPDQFNQAMGNAMQMKNGLDRDAVQLQQAAINQDTQNSQRQQQFDAEIVAEIPAWGNPDQRATLINEGVNYLRSQGMSDAEINAMQPSPGQVKMIYNQMRGATQAAEAKAKQKVLSAKQKKRAKHADTMKRIQPSSAYQSNVDDQTDAVANLLMSL